MASTEKLQKNFITLLPWVEDNDDVASTLKYLLIEVSTHLCA